MFRSGSFLFVLPLMAVAAQTPPPLPPVRPIGPVVASTTSLPTVSQVLPLRDGSLLVNLPSRAGRKLLKLDTTFHELAIVADTMPATDIQYGFEGAGIMRYLGDSVLFIEPGSPTLYVIDPFGKFVRALSVPTPRDAAWMIGSPFTNVGTDALGRIVYRGPGPQRPPRQRPKPGETLTLTLPDSAPITRSDMATRKSEIVTWYKQRRNSGKQVGWPDGTSTYFPVYNPTDATDAYAILSDGTIAILKADYHLQLISADGTVTETPRITYPWQRLTDSMKLAIIDSVKRAAHTPTPASRTIGNGSSGAGASMPHPIPEDAYATLDQMSDYLPAFHSNAVYADANGNLWVRTNQRSPVASTVVIDVISRGGKLLDRIAMPDGRLIVGFDATHVYLTNESGAPVLERVRIR